MDVPHKLHVARTNRMPRPRLITAFGVCFLASKAPLMRCQASVKFAITEACAERIIGNRQLAAGNSAETFFTVTDRD
jgi:hypothetical protein